MILHCGDCDTEILDYEGRTYESDANGFSIRRAGVSPVTGNEYSLARVFFHVTDSSDFTGEDKYAAYKLCGRLNSGDGEIEITVEEASLIKRVAASAFIAGGYGQVCELVENTNIKPEKGKRHGN